MATSKTVAQVVLGFSMVWGSAWAQPALAKAAVDPAELNQRPADMREVLRFVRAELRQDSKEAFATRAATEAASGTSAASRLAFLGGLKMQAERDFTKPGFTDTVTLPLPAQLGGPQSAGIVLIPKLQNVYTIGWSLPIINLQALAGLRVAARTRAQEQVVTQLELEAAVRTKIDLLLRYELMQELRRVRNEQVAVARSRLETVLSRVEAGIAHFGQKVEAEAALASAQAEVAQAAAASERLRVEFQEQSGLALPEQGLGLPQFPFVPEKPFDPLTLKALRGTAEIHEAAATAADAAFLPSVDAAVSRQIKQYDGAPDPQNSLGLSATWVLLDGGTRRRLASDQRRDELSARSDAAAAELDLQTAYKTLRTRRNGADFALTARKAAYLAAGQGVQDSVAAYGSGSGRLIDVRNADDQRFSAELGVYQAHIDLVTVAVESLVLTGQLVPFVNNGGHL